MTATLLHGVAEVGEPRRTLFSHKNGFLNHLTYVGPGMECGDRNRPKRYDMID